MLELALVVIGAVLGFLALAVGFAYLEGDEERRRRDALPGGYSPEAYFADPAKVPGRCPECYHDNDPAFDFCEECATELPDLETPDDNRSIRDLFGR